jgi:hypothetical protein
MSGFGWRARTELRTGCNDVPATRLDLRYPDSEIAAADSVRTKADSKPGVSVAPSNAVSRAGHHDLSATHLELRQIALFRFRTAHRRFEGRDCRYILTAFVACMAAGHASRRQ